MTVFQQNFRSNTLPSTKWSSLGRGSCGLERLCLRPFFPDFTYKIFLSCTASTLTFLSASLVSSVTRSLTLSLLAVTPLFSFVSSTSKTRSLSCLLLLTVPQLPELGKPSPRSETTCDVVGFSANCERRLRLPRLRNALRCCDLQNFAVTLAAAHSSPTTDRRRRQDARKVLRSHTAHRDADQKSECQ